MLFIVYIAIHSIDDEKHFSKRALIAYLKADEAPTKVLSKYTDFVDVSSPKLTAKLPKYIKINNYTIELIDNQEHLYGPIYSFGFVELEM